MQALRMFPHTVRSFNPERNHPFAWVVRSRSSKQLQCFNFMFDLSSYQKMTYTVINGALPLKNTIYSFDTNGLGLEKGLHSR